MSIIEQAARRLDQLKRAGVEVPWAAAGVSEAEVVDLAGASAKARAAGSAHPRPESEYAPGTVEPIRPLPVAPVRESANETARPSPSVKIDLDHLAQEGYLVPGQRRSALTDEFRAIKRPLLKNARGESVTPIQRGNLIMLTSALPGEGKTFCAINLALSLVTEVDISVLLVDSDVVRPAILNRLGISGRFDGLLDVLSDPRRDLASVILRTNIDKLQILPPGHQRFDSTELLASGAMEDLLDMLAREHPDQIVIFDAPPLLVTTESKVLASRVGQILVIVDQQRTSPHDVAKAFAIVSAMPLVSSLLNKSRTASDTDRYGYYEA